MTRLSRISFHLKNKIKIPLQGHLLPWAKPISESPSRPIGRCPRLTFVASIIRDFSLWEGDALSSPSLRWQSFHQDLSLAICAANRYNSHVSLIRRARINQNFLIGATRLFYLSAECYPKHSAKSRRTFQKIGKTLPSWGWGFYESGPRAPLFPTVPDSGTWRDRLRFVTMMGWVTAWYPTPELSMPLERKSWNPKLPSEFCNAPTLDCRSIAMIELKIRGSEFDHEVSLILN